ncbi:hypothetical protein Taro_035471 [Colocasia esculenta]|uniref:Uncharacterized protein n=1 Tax=Colocasia esculenta TaxID=4460 RepID=A0A843WAL5_COLES|nr:hypothetical protein [Colocasia esculenta]
MSPSQHRGLKAWAPEPLPPLSHLSFPPLSLALSELPSVLGCLPRVEAAVLRRVTLRSCRGCVRAVRCEEETTKPTRRPQRVRSSRGGESSQQRQGVRQVEETGRLPIPALSAPMMP